MTPRFGIAGKFLAIVSLIALVLLTTIAMVMIRTSKEALSQQADTFVTRLQAINTEQGILLRQELITKGESVATLLGQISTSHLLSYDFTALQQLADSVMKDPHFAFVTFFNKDGKSVTKQVTAPKDSQVIKKEIVFSEKKIGSLELGIVLDSAAEAMRKISQQVDTTMAESNAVMARAERAIIYRMLLALLAGLLALCLGTYFALKRFVIHPVQSVCRSIAGGTEQVAAAAGQVASASHQLADGASEQAASIEQTSASLEEMASMTKLNAENSTHANRLMVEATKIVEHANYSMSQLTASMSEISKASEETQKIIKTIDEIAFQTNLLALNAAVEAARAGEAGAGFAVVADEVRNLAMRAADAAKNTAGLIEGTVKKIKEGSELVQKTNGEFSEVSTSVTKSGELVGEIAAASNDQAQGIDQINKAVSEMDRVTQQNAASAEQSASASEEMNAQAAQMEEFVAELVALMGGAANGSGAYERQQASPGADRGRSSKEVIRVKALTKVPKQIMKGKGGEANHRVSGGREGAREVSPKQLIPFDDDDF